ncbi:hypothetical protein M5D96_000096 [Drosophila gunungcola]|uniref:Uncharacterized protein n=1 Tax=Drosophila gunungcola TaxID=103775 RepID=A0A9P9YW33_9MUSC|nr:hypothetical protein M5D96_000096 [Drosophila gunungcola]
MCIKIKFLGGRLLCLYPLKCYFCCRYICLLTEIALMYIFFEQCVFWKKVILTKSNLYRNILAFIYFLIVTYTFKLQVFLKKS